MFKKIIFKNHIIFLLTIALILGSLLLQPISSVQAGALTSLSDTMSRLKINTAANHNIIFTTPGGVAAGQTIVVTFPTDFTTTGVDYTDIDLLDDGSNLTLAASASGTTWGAVFGGTGNRTLTFTSGTGTIAASSIITILIGTNAVSGTTGDAQMVNPTTQGNYTISLSTGSSTDTGKIGVYIINDDQVAVSGTVDPTITFTISTNTIGFGSFVGTAVRYATSDSIGSATVPANGAPVALAASTNAKTGWTMTLIDTNSGLYSSVLSELIPSDIPTDVSDGSKSYAVYGKNAGSGVTISEDMDGDGNNDVAINSTTITDLASTSGPSTSVGLDLVFKAAVDAITKAGQYSDTVTIICTGRY